MIVKTVPGESPYLACSSIVTAGEPASSDLIPAIMSIIFEECGRLGMIDDYPSVEAPLTPETPQPLADVNLYNDPEELIDQGIFSDDPTTDDSNSYCDSPPDSKRKQSARRPQGSRIDPKRVKSQKEKQVSSSPYNRALVITSQRS
jgi:hypothetical protein